nr:hypothetical protein Iba_chr05cCG8020 [Ipomoea batatas]
MPSNAGEPLDGQGTESSQHGPPAMNELTFPEPLDPEHLTVRLKRSRLNVGALYPGPNDVSGHILRQVLVQRVQLKLQVLSGLRQPERVEPNVTHQASVQPFRRLRSGEPRRPQCPHPAHPILGLRNSGPEERRRGGCGSHGYKSIIHYGFEDMMKLRRLGEGYREVAWCLCMAIFGRVCGSCWAGNCERWIKESIKQSDGCGGVALSATSFGLWRKFCLNWMVF